MNRSRRRNSVKPAYDPNLAVLREPYSAFTGMNLPQESDKFYRELYYMSDTLVIAASTGAGTVGVTKNQQIRVDSDAPFEAQKIAFIATDPRIKIRIRTSNGQYITPEFIDLQAIGGTPFNAVGPSSNVSWFTPYILSKPFLFSMSSDIIVEAADYSGSTNTLRYCFWGSKIWGGKAPWKDKRYRQGQPTIRSTDRITIAANASKTLSINIDSDADLLLTKAQAVRTGAALVSVSEGARGADWGNSQTHIDNIFGSGQFAHKLSAGRFIPRNSSITFNVQDISTAENIVELVLEGIKYE